MRNLQSTLKTDVKQLNDDEVWERKGGLLILAQNRCKIWSLSHCNWNGTQNHIVRKQTLNHLAKLVVIYKLSGSVFESSCSHLNFRLCACFEHRVPWHSGNYRVWIPSETRMWHDKKIQSVKDCLHTAGMFKLSSRRWSWWNNGKLQSYQSAERGYVKDINN